MTTTTNKPMTPEQAEDLATRTLAKIDYIEKQVTDAGLPLDAILDRHTADRERVASDLAGLRAHEDCGAWHHGDGPCADEARYEAGLRRTARLYGVTDA